MIKLENSFDYKNFDKLVVTVKRDKQEGIINDYRLFGWEKIETADDDVFYDLVHLTFSRPHVIENKDELLYLQVCYEERLNKASDLERYKYSLSSVFYCTLLTFVVLGIILSLISILKYSNILIGILFVLGSILLSGLIIPINKLRKRENGKYIDKVNEILEQIKDILQKVKSLRGIKDEK